MNATVKYIRPNHLTVDELAVLCWVLAYQRTHHSWPTNGALKTRGRGRDWAGESMPGLLRGGYLELNGHLLKLTPKGMSEARGETNDGSA